MWPAGGVTAGEAHRRNPTGLAAGMTGVAPATYLGEAVESRGIDPPGVTVGMAPGWVASASVMVLLAAAAAPQSAAATTAVAPSAESPAAAISSPGSPGSADLAATAPSAAPGTRGLESARSVRGRRDTSVVGWRTQPRAVVLGRSLKTRVRVQSGKRYIRRTVVVQQKLPLQRWMSVRDRTNSRGWLRLRLRAEFAGITVYRLKVRPEHGFRKVVTGSKSLLGLSDYGPKPDSGTQPSPTEEQSPDTSTDPAPVTRPREDSAGGDLCEPPATYSVSGFVSHPELSEISGMVASRNANSTYWVHNDSGNGADLFALSANGGIRGRVAILGAPATDWEDIARGPGPRRGVDYLFVADIGDNLRARGSILVHRFEEPAFDSGSVSAADYDTFELTYPDGPHDAETLLVDPIGGELVIMTKEWDGSSRIYSAGPFAVGSASTELRFRGAVQLGVLATAGDVSADGTRVLLRSYADIRGWQRDPAGPLWQAFTEPGCAMASADENQGEAVAFTADGDGYATISEGRFSPINTFTFPG